MNDVAADHYIGDELELFQHAVHWKQYFAKYVKPHLGGRVLEVGAGIGETAPFLCASDVSRWTFLEPDSGFCDQLEKTASSGRISAACNVINGTLSSLAEEECFDVILYMDVLEHIEQDRDELKLALSHLNAGGRIVVLAPAHQFLFSEFDASIGHFRRYSLKQLRLLCPKGMETVTAKYLDSAGMLASMANRMLLRQSRPDLKQILFWDRVLVPVSRLADPFLLHRIGKSALVVYEKI